MEDAPTISEDERPAVLALVTKYSVLWLKNRRLTELQKEIAEELPKLQTTLNQLHSAFAAFGFNTTEGGFKLIRTAVGNDLYIAALRKADYPEAELIFDDPKPENRPQETSNEGVVLPPPSSIREAVLDLAKAAFPQAVFAAELRKALEKQRGGTLHDKTIGMTLYRLSKDGLMRREGQKNWFYVPPLTAETKNPGAEDAGAFNRDDKEGEAL